MSSILKRWNEPAFQKLSPTNEAIILKERNEPIYDVERTLRWWRSKIKNKNVRGLLVLWAGYPLEEAPWDPEVNFLDHIALQKDLDNGLFPEDK